MTDTSSSNITGHEGNTSAKRLAGNISLNVIATIGDSVLTFFLIPFLILHLHKDGYGIWTLVGTFFSYSLMIQLSISSGISRYVAYYHGQGNKPAIQRVMATGNICFVFAGVLLIPITLIGINYFQAWFSIPDHLLSSSKWMIFIVGMSWAIVLSFQSFPAALCGYQRYGFFRGVGLLGNITRASLLFLILPFGIGLIGTAIIFGSVQVAVRILMVIFVLHFLGRTSFRFWPFDRSLFWKMFSFGANVIFYDLGTMVIYKGANVIIGIFMLVSNVTEYSVLVALLMMLSAFTHTFNTAIMPAMASLHGQNKQKQIKDFYLVLQKFSILFILPSICFFIIMGKAFLNVWVGPDFSRLWPVLTVLSVGHFFRLLQDCNFKVLSGLNKHRFYGNMVLVVSILIITASIVAMKLNMGLMGIAWVNSIVMFLFFGILMEAYFHKKLAVSSKQIAKHVWLPSFLGCCPAIICMVLWRMWRPPTSWLELILVAVIAGGLVLIFSWLWAMTDRERNKLKSLLLEKIGKQSS